VNRDVFSGSLLIAGALAGLVVMALHPTAHGLMEGPGAGGQARLNVIVHGVALAAVAVVFLGLLGLARRLGSGNLTNAALVFWGLGGAAVISAAVASGFVAPAVIERMSEAGGEGRATQEALLAYTGQLNQGFATVYVVATFVAVILWSVAIVRSGRMARAAGIVGVVLSALVLLAVLAGHLRLGVHGFGIVTLAQSVWLVWVGFLLCLGGESRSETPRS
jgi:hypothetical protein